MNDLGQLARLLAAPAGEPGGRFFGVAVGIVSNIDDPEGLNRVKLRLPWLTEEHESDWTRVLTPMAGNDRGLCFLPEVDDEVLVAFEHGRVDRPFVLGGLWNGQDLPPETIEGGANDRRTIKSRSGHVIRLDDTDGAEKIEIVDAGGGNSIVIDTANNSIAVTADADITIESTGGKLILKATAVQISSQGDVKIEADGNMDLKAGGQLNVKGAMVNIN